jgi:hypothetical protein
MCAMDIGVLGYRWVNRTDPMPFPDFKTAHVCRNFEEIREWAERNQVPEDMSDDFMELPGADVEVLDDIP